MRVLLTIAAASAVKNAALAPVFGAHEKGMEFTYCFPACDSSHYCAKDKKGVSRCFPKIHYGNDCGQVGRYAGVKCMVSYSAWDLWTGWIFSPYRNICARPSENAEPTCTTCCKVPNTCSNGEPNCGPETCANGQPSVWYQDDFQECVEVKKGDEYTCDWTKTPMKKRTASKGFKRCESLGQSGRRKEFGANVLLCPGSMVELRHKLAYMARQKGFRENGMCDSENQHIPVARVEKVSQKAVKQAQKKGIVHRATEKAKNLDKPKKKETAAPKKIEAKPQPDENPEEEKKEEGDGQKKEGGDGQKKKDGEAEGPNAEANAKAKKEKEKKLADQKLDAAAEANEEASGGGAPKKAAKMENTTEPSAKDKEEAKKKQLQAFLDAKK